MKNIIVAVGGGENGRVLEDGNCAPYNTGEIDKEIVKLSNKKNPNFLFICHAISSLELQESYYQTMKKIYGDIYNCNCDDLKTNELDKYDIVMEKIEWADIIYEGGGDTAYMINIWKKFGFDRILFNAWKSGKVISGISAGAMCWFNSGNSYGNAEFVCINCLNWLDYYFTPHADEKGRIDSSVIHLKENNKKGIILSNCCAIEIVDGYYKIIKSSDEAFVYLMLWENNQLYKVELPSEGNLLDLDIYKLLWPNFKKHIF